jgi:hypothetical protein
MKKIALLIAFTLIFVFTSFAQVDVTVTGKSELTFGIALDDPIATGFTNVNESKIEFTLAADTSEKGGEEDVHGYIKIDGWEIKGNTDDEAWSYDAGDVEAKVMFSGGWIKISGTNDEIQFVDPVQDDDSDKDNTDHGMTTTLDNSGGLVVGLDFAPAAIELGLFSENDWADDADTADEYDWVDDDGDATTPPVWDVVTAGVADDLNDDHAYGASVKVTLDMSPITVAVGAILGVGHTSKDIGIGGKVDIAADPITAYVAADVQLDSDDADAPHMEFSGGVSVAIAEGLSVAVDGSYCDAAVDNTDVKVALTANDVVPNLELGVTFELYNLLGGIDAASGDTDDDAEYAVDVSLSYTAGSLKPYAGVRYGTFTIDDDEIYTYVAADEEPLKLNLGVELSMIENVTLKLDYNSDDLTSSTSSNGVIKVITTISY